MVMGPTHAMSGAALWLGAAATSAPLLGGQTASAVVVGAAVCAGSALLPDIDCPGSLSTKDGSTVVRAFGVLGEIVGHTTDNVAMTVYNLTRGKKDKPRNSGHRTLTHTALFTAGLGFAVSAGAKLPGSFNLLGREWGTGNVFALVVMWAMLHLAMFGLLEKWTKKQRAKHGLLFVMAISGLLTLVTASQLERTDGGFGWLGLAVGAGAVMHCIGDAITKAGVPFIWPIPINGKHWYDITLPSFMRIRAGGTFEYAILLPALTIYTFLAAIYLMPGGKAAINSVRGIIGV
jgi:membrane-bound metal-dependent hydrolase YbcI (DUF457 family)